MSIKAGLPTKTKTFGGERYKLKEAVHWRGKRYRVRVTTFDGAGTLPRTKHYCLYYHPSKKRRSK